MTNNDQTERDVLEGWNQALGWMVCELQDYDVPFGQLDQIRTIRNLLARVKIKREMIRIAKAECEERMNK